MTDKPTCRTCPYWCWDLINRPDGIPLNGQCRKSPHFFDRKSTDWCGEHPQFNKDTSHE